MASPTKTILPPAWKTPDLFKARLGESAGRQRAMSADGHLLLVLHAPPEPGDDERVGRLFWRDPDGSWKSNALGTGIQALKTHLAQFAERIDRLEDDLQSASGADDYFHLLQVIAPLNRAARNMHATLQQARELMPTERELIALRDQAYDLERSSDLLHSDAKNGLDFTVAHHNEEQTRRAYDMAVASHRLNLLVAAFFPIATLSTIFGMNISHGLETWSGPDVFWGVLALGLFVGLILTFLVARRPPPLIGAAPKKKAKRP